MKTAVKSARWLRSRLLRGAVILGYHRIADEAEDPYGLCVSPEHFLEQLQILRELARPMSMRDLLDSIDGGGVPPGAVVLTIDDGYRDALDTAWPLLESLDIPCTLFIAVGFLGRAFWWDEIARLVLGASALPQQISFATHGHRFVWPDRNGSRSSKSEYAGAARKALLDSLYSHMTRLESADRISALRQLSRQLRTSCEIEPSAHCLGENDLLRLAAEPLVEIGAHSLSHPALALLSPTAQAEEIRQSKLRIEAAIGKEVTGFSYPHGSFDQVTKEIVSGEGFSYACASYSDVVYRTRGRYDLPRFWVPDSDGDAFGRWLHTWLRV